MASAAGEPKKGTGIPTSLKPVTFKDPTVKCKYGEFSNGKYITSLSITTGWKNRFTFTSDGAAPSFGGFGYVVTGTASIEGRESFPIALKAHFMSRATMESIQNEHYCLNAVQLYHGSFQLNDEIYTIMSNAGKDLFNTMLPLDRSLDKVDAFREKNWTIDAIQEIVIQLLLNLSNLHKKNITHNDIKLENVLLDETDKTKPKVTVADFGSATQSNCLTNLDGQTILYLAPNYVDDYIAYQDLDIYAVGVVLAQMILNSETVAYIIDNNSKPTESMFKIRDKKLRKDILTSVSNYMLAKLKIENSIYAKAKKEDKKTTEALLHLVVILTGNERPNNAAEALATMQKLGLYKPKATSTETATPCLVVMKKATGSTGEAAAIKTSEHIATN